MPKLSDTYYGQQRKLDRQLQYAFKFLYENIIYIRNADVTNEIKDMNPAFNTLFTKMFNLIKREGKLDKFFFVNLLRVQESIPEVLLFKGMVIDGENTKYPNEEELNRITLNITPYVKVNKDRDLSNPFVITDSGAISELVCKGFLCHSYNGTKSIWLNNEIMTFVIKIFILAMSNKMITYYKLEGRETITRLRVLLGLYFMQQFDIEKKDPNIVGKLMATKLFDRNEVMDTVHEIYQFLGKPQYLDLHITIRLLQIYVSENMKRMDYISFTRIFYSYIPTENIIDRVGLEYPPFWVYTVMYGIENKKSTIGYLMKNNKLLDEGKKLFEKFISDQHFYKGV